jgi:hypothetical protein
MWYFDPPEGVEELQNTGGLTVNYLRQVNERLSFGDALYLTYQTQPDFQVGSSITRPNSGYFYGSNNFWVNYRWSTHFSTMTSWTASAISYDDETHQDENNTRQLFSEKLRYALTQRTAVSLEYRFGLTDYPDNPAANSESNYLLFGVERPLSRFISMSVNGGAEWRAYDSALGNETAPIIEAAIDYRARENTTFRWYYRSGLEDTGSAGTQSNTTIRTGLTMSHRFGQGLSLNVALNGIRKDFLKSPTVMESRTEDTFEVTAGLSYHRHLWRRFGLNASYSFSMVNSDDEFSEYNRHQASLGISAQF